MTNDDKLRRLREWLDGSDQSRSVRWVRLDDCRQSDQGEIASKVVRQLVLDEIDRLLNEPTSPAPAAAPSEAAASIVQAVSERPYCSAREDDPDELTVSRSDLVDIIMNRWPAPPNEAEIVAWRHKLLGKLHVAKAHTRGEVQWPDQAAAYRDAYAATWAEILAVIDQGQALMRRATAAPAAAPSEAIEAAEREADAIVAAAKEANGTQPIGLSKHLRRLIGEALMRRASAPSEAAPPVTDPLSHEAFLARRAMRLQFGKPLTFIEVHGPGRDYDFVAFCCDHNVQAERCAAEWTAEVIDDLDAGQNGTVAIYCDETGRCSVCEPEEVDDGN